MKISSLGLEAIKKFEGFRAKAYDDVAGKKTIGYGHLIVPGDGVVDYITKYGFNGALALVSSFAGLGPIATTIISTLP